MAIFKGEKTKDGRQWYFRSYYTDLYGNKKQFKSKKYESKNEAKKQEAIFILKKKNFSNKITFLTLTYEYLEELKIRTKESTYYSHESVIKAQIMPYFPEKNINDINIQAIKIWHEKLDNKNLSIRYKNKCHMIMKNILTIGVKFHGLESNAEDVIGPFKKSNEEIVTDDEKIRYITFDQFNQFIANVDDIMWFTFFSLLYYTGMRKGEVQALNWNDIDLINNIITVNKTLTVKVKKDVYKLTSTKNLQNRKITINKTLNSIIKKYLEYEKNKIGFNKDWFVFGDTKFLSQTTIDRKKHHYFLISNLNEITCHEFRHSHVSLIINEGIKNNFDMKALFIMLSQRLGHTIGVMQKTYMHLFPNTQDTIVKMLDNL